MRRICLLAALAPFVLTTTAPAAPKKPAPAVVKKLLKKDYDDAYETIAGSKVTLAYTTLAIRPGRRGDYATDGIPPQKIVFPTRTVFVQTYDSGPDGYVKKKRFTLRILVYRDDFGWAYKMVKQDVKEIGCEDPNGLGVC